MKKTIYLIIPLLIAMPITLIACASSTEQPCPEYPRQNRDSAADELPAFIIEIWPPPDGSLEQRCYDSSIFIEDGQNLVDGYRGIGVWLNTGEIDEFVAEATYENLPARVHLIVDGEKFTDAPIFSWYSSSSLLWIRNGVRYRSGEADSYQMSWGPSLAAGEHEACLVILNNLGKTLEFSWKFSIR